MSSNTDTEAPTTDRVKLPFSFDVAKMQSDIKALGLTPFNYYDSIPLRGPAHIIDPSLPPPPPADDYADGTWTEWKDTSILQKSPYLNEIADFFKQNTRVTLIRVLRLEAGATVREHTDPTLGLHIERSVIRLTIPVFINDKVTFYLNSKPVGMKQGECWYLNLTDPHRITNESDEERINITIDMEPNEWIRGVIAEHI
jgi:hypothetical protein